MRPSVLCRQGENTRRFPARRTPRTFSFRDKIRIQLLDMLLRIRLM